MQNNILIVTVFALFAIILTNCGVILHEKSQTYRSDFSPAIVKSAISPKELTQSRSRGGQGWKRLMQIGPGNDAIVTLTDGTLQGGHIVEVRFDELLMLIAGKDKRIARSDIAMLTVKRSSYALAGGLIGFLISGIGLTAIVCDDCSTDSWIVGIALLGIPGGLIGALIGSQTGGDEEIIP